METRSRAKRRKMSKLTTASFDDLPEEIILQIFKNLEFYDNASASQVCKRWKLLCEDQSLWLKTNLNNRRVPAKFIEKALKRGCHYLGLYGTEIKNVPGPHSSFSIKNQLKYLTISCDYTYPQELVLHEDLMKNLLGATQFLEKLSIQCDRENSFNFQPNITQNNQTLTVLRISSLKTLSFDAVKVIFNNCLELVEVSLEDCGMSDEALSFLCNNLTNKIKKLSLFRITGFDSEDYILEEKHVIALANRCPQLEELDLGGQENLISEVALSAIIEKLKNLVKLKLPNTGQVQFPKLLELQSMTNLKYLWVHVDIDVEPIDLISQYPDGWTGANNAKFWYERLYAARMKTPLMKALVKNLPNLKINEGRFKIATPNPSFLSKDDGLWEICKPTADFVGFLWF